MPVTSEYLEHGIILQHFTGKLTISSFAEGQEAAMQVLASAEEDYIVVIIEVSEATASAQDFNISSARQLIKADKDKTIGFVFIGASQGMKMLINMFKRVLGIKMMYADDVDSATLEARKILNAYEN